MNLIFPVQDLLVVVDRQNHPQVIAIQDRTANGKNGHARAPAPAPDPALLAAQAAEVERGLGAQSIGGLDVWSGVENKELTHKTWCFKP